MFFINKCAHFIVTTFLTLKFCHQKYKLLAPHLTSQINLIFQYIVSNFQFKFKQWSQKKLLHHRLVLDLLCLVKSTHINTNIQNKNINTKGRRKPPPRKPHAHLNDGTPNHNRSVTTSATIINPTQITQSNSGQLGGNATPTKTGAHAKSKTVNNLTVNMQMLQNNNNNNNNNNHNTNNNHSSNNYNDDYNPEQFTFFFVTKKKKHAKSQNRKKRKKKTQLFVECLPLHNTRTQKYKQKNTHTHTHTHTH